MSDRKNIIYILSDQHNPFVMGNAGDSYVRTPNLDRLYAEGTGFDNCYCSCPLCVPSRAGILTGQLASHNGVYNNMQALSSCNATFPASLTVNGYETVLAGRMHFVGWDQWHGYEKHFVGDITPDFVGEDNEEEIYGSFKRSSGQNLTSIRKSGAGNSAVLDYDRDVLEKALSYMSEREDDRPLFMTIGFYGPHCPYIAPKELYDYYYNLLPEIDFPSKEERDRMHPAEREWFRNRKIDEVTKEDVRRIRAAYYAMVELLDSYVGRIVETVKNTLGLENTLIIYTSDHGDNIGEHGYFWKTNFYDAAARVPMVFVGEGIEKGRRIREINSLIDLAPTILDYTSSPLLPSMDGRNLLPVLYGKESPDRERIAVSMCSDIKGDNPSFMIRKGRFKYVCHAGYDNPQLFDMENDVHECTDLVPGGKYDDVIRDFRNIQKDYWDPEKAMNDLRDAKTNFSLMTKWFATVKPALVGEWRGDPSRNYLLP